MVFVIQDESELILHSQSSLANRGDTFPCLGLVGNTPQMLWGETPVYGGEDGDGDTQTTPCPWQTERACGKSGQRAANNSN